MLFKVCGICNSDDLRYCVEAGVPFVGFNLISSSPRVLSEKEAQELWAGLKDSRKTQAVLVCSEPLEKLNEIAERWKARFGRYPVLQHHGHAFSSFRPRKAELWQAAHPRSSAEVQDALAWDVDLVLFDGPKPGTGERFDWSLLPNTKRAWGLAGGINAENLSDALAANPSLIDVCSGVESSKRKKDHAKIAHIWNNMKTFEAK